MEDTRIPAAKTVVDLHDVATTQWHLPDDGLMIASDGMFEAMILAQHRENFDLWHEEDEARNPDASAGRIADVKHAIDRLNQRRNDLVEAMDASLATTLQQNADASLHSETPGMMIDRLSIMALKIFHTREETMRASASEAHRDKNIFRLSVLMEQRSDLAGCLDGLIADIRSGRRRFKIYRQMKMYNDPELNPVLYRQGGK
jgi:hypothetical protein